MDDPLIPHNIVLVLVGNEQLADIPSRRLLTRGLVSSAQGLVISVDVVAGYYMLFEIS